MRLELAERLVCPAAHVRTPLIVVAREVRERELVHGSLGCMHCHREGELRDGAVFLTRDRAPLRAARVAADGDVARVIALLALAEPGARVLLAGRYAALAAAVAMQAEATVVVLNAEASAEGVASVWVDEPTIPFSDATFAAAALDATVPAPMWADAMRVLRPGARLLAPVDLPAPDGARELARDATEWVAETTGATPVIPLRRA